MIKNNYKLIIFALFFSFKNFFASEKSEEFKRDYTASTSRVISCGIGEYSITNNLFKHDGYLHNKDLVDNVLVCLDSNNKLFTCYSGYKMVDHWELSTGYRTNPIIQKKLNVLTETDSYTKIEYKFNDVPELCNEYPVNDIARRKNNYYVAHQNNVYIYQSNNAHIRSLALLRRNHLKSKDDQHIIKKIFIDKDDNVIAITSLGCVLRNSSHSQSSDKQILSFLYQTFPSDEILYSIAYNELNNIVLLGGHNFIQIIPLNDSMKAIQIAIDQLRISHIDTNNEYILLSDLIQNQNERETRNHKGHHAKQQCCIEKTFPHNTLRDCQTCTEYKKNWQQRKESWENQKLEISLKTTRKTINQDIQQYLHYDVPQPPECPHKTPDAKATSFINSCRENTIVLLSLSSLIGAMTENSTRAKLIKHRIHHKHLNECDTLVNAFLINDFLFIGCLKTVHSSLNHFIYQVPLNTINKDTINQLFKTPYEKSFYYSSEPDLKNSNYESAPMSLSLIIQRNENGTIAIIDKTILCSKWCQFFCTSKEHWLERIHNIALFSKNNPSGDARVSSLMRSLRRAIRHFKTLDVPLASIHIFGSLAIQTCTFFALYKLALLIGIL